MEFSSHTTDRYLSKSINDRSLIYDDCCLLSNINLNSERTFYRLERRFKSNSTLTSFDFKSFLPEQPSNNAKVSRSLLKLYPKINSINNHDENISSESSEEEIEEISSPKLSTNNDNDDYLDRLANWQPDQFQPLIENDDDESEILDQPINDENTVPDLMESSPAMPATQVEDLLVTFIHRPIKNEPIITDLIPPQLDGQTDLLSDNNHKRRKPNNQNKNFDEVIGKIKSTSPKTIQINTRSNPNQNLNQKELSLINADTYFKDKINTRHSQLPSSILEKSVWEHMKLAEQKLGSVQKTNDSNKTFIQRKIISLNNPETPRRISKSTNSNITKNKRLDISLNHQSRTKKRSKSKSNNKFPMEHSGKTLLDYFEVIKPPSDVDYKSKTIDKHINRLESAIKRKARKRSANYFDGCIVIDDEDDEEEDDNNKNSDEDDDTIKNNDEDDDIQEIERQSSSISYNIHAREKLLDHAVHSPIMRIKWLLNLELLLFEHISICHEEKIRPLNKFYSNLQSSNDNPIIKFEYSDNSLSYHIDSSFISIVVLNFLKMFIIRNSMSDQDELCFFQFGLTSHIRYLLIELPSYNHLNNNNNENNCLQCYQYSLIINILFDLLFDLIEYDLCEITSKEKYRSSLIENDYFNQLTHKKKRKKTEFYRIKLIIYFIELIGVHRNKCQEKKEFLFNKNEKNIFQWIEDSIRHIVHQMDTLNNERISICFNVMELCLLFVHEKQNRIKQMALFLTKLCEEMPTYLELFLFDKNLLSDIRLLLINELIWNKFNVKFISVDHIDEFFQLVEDSLKPPNSIDDTALLLIRSLFNTYADLMIDMKHSIFIYSASSEKLTSILRNQLESMCTLLTNLSYDSNYVEQIKRTVILFRLLKSKWNRL